MKKQVKVRWVPFKDSDNPGSYSYYRGVIAVSESNVSKFQFLGRKRNVVKGQYNFSTTVPCDLWCMLLRSFNYVFFSPYHFHDISCNFTQVAVYHGRWGWPFTEHCFMARSRRSGESLGGWNHAGFLIHTIHVWHTYPHDPTSFISLWNHM